MAKAFDRQGKKLDKLDLLRCEVKKLWAHMTPVRCPFLESPGTFSSPKANFEIKTCWIVAQFLAQKQVNFV